MIAVIILVNEIIIKYHCKGDNRKIYETELNLRAEIIKE